MDKNSLLAKHRGWLLPTVLILFILEVITFPFVLGFTLADRSETPKRLLTYTPGKLTWDSADQIDETGAATLALFDSVYHNVNADNGDKVVAPGTEGVSIVRLRNTADKAVSYTAVLYRIRSTDLLPVDVSLSGDGFTDTNTYRLPEGVMAKDGDVIRAVSGTLGGNMIQDFDVDWTWRFYDSDKQDIIDTWLGDKAANGFADDVTVGLYIVVEDDNRYFTPDVPPTGDLGVGIYIVLMCISGIVLVLLLLDKRRARKCEE